MNTFLKHTTGWVTQTYRKKGGNFVCIHQEFNASGDVEFTDAENNPIEPPEDYPYQPYDMTLEKSGT